MKKKLTNNLLYKILSVVFAIVIWLVVMNIDDPSKTVTIRGIAVELLNSDVITNNAQVYTVISGGSCNVTVTGPRSIVDKLSSDDFTASADFNEISQTNAIPINVSLNKDNSKYENKLNIVQQTNTMRVQLENVISKDYTITAEFNGELPDNYMLGTPGISENTVTITAAESIIASIENVKAIINVNGDTTENVSRIADLSFYNAAGNVVNYNSKTMKISISQVKVTAIMYIVKEIPVKYTINDDVYIDYRVTGSDIDKSTIKVYGIKSNIGSINEMVIPDEYLDVSNLDKSEFVINVEELLPTGIKPCDGYETVTITIETTDIINKSFTIDTNDVMIRKIPDGYEASIVDSGEITVLLRGMETLFDELDVDSLHPYVDLSGAKEGENNVSLNLTLPEGINLMEEVNIKVSVTNKGSDPTSEKETDAETDAETDLAG